MKRLQIKTAQNVNINFVLANVGQRLFAFGIDNILKLGYILFAVYVLKFGLFKGNFSDDGWTLKAIDVLILLPLTFYSLYSEILMNGQTIGKRLLKIKVINIDRFDPSVNYP